MKYLVIAKPEGGLSQVVEAKDPNDAIKIAKHNPRGWLEDDITNRDWTYYVEPL